MLKLSISFVDGSATDCTERDSFYARLVSLRRSDVEGKDLIETLISDDWGAPPRFVRLTGQLSDGTVVNESIRYQ